MDRLYLVEYGEIEVVVVVGDGNIAAGRHPNTNGEVRNTFTTDLPQVVALVVKHLDTVSPVVTDEHFLVVIHCHAIGELKVPENLSS